MKMFMKKAGAGVPSANRITLLRDANGDGMAEVKTPFITDLYSPFGMALVGSTLYVANADAVRSEEHTSELQSLMRISYAVFCLKKKTKQRTDAPHDINQA